MENLVLRKRPAAIPKERLRSWRTSSRMRVPSFVFRCAASAQSNMATSLICGRLSAGLRNSGSRTTLSSAAKVSFVYMHYVTISDHHLWRLSHFWSLIMTPKSRFRFDISLQANSLSLLLMLTLACQIILNSVYNLGGPQMIFSGSWWLFVYMFVINSVVMMGLLVYFDLTYMVRLTACQFQFSVSVLL